MMRPTHPKYKWFVLVVLTIVFMFNFVDRQVMIILQEDIKADLDLSDTQLGLLTGLAFAVLYTTLGIPIAKFADTSNRKNVVVVSLAFWSIMTVLSGRAQNFFQMLLTRIGVSVGEAGGVPPSHSIISDYFPPKERATAFSIYTMGLYLGIFVGFIGAGIIAKHYGWRVAFYALGFPGVLFAIFTFFTIKEPIKGRFDANERALKDPTFAEVLQVFSAKKSFIYMALGSGFAAFSLYGMNNFMPSYLLRMYNFDIAEISVILGISIGLGGIIGAFLGGRIADVKGVKNKKWYLYVPLLASLCSLFPAFMMLYTNASTIALGMIFPYILIASSFNGPIYAIGQSLVNAKMRAFASAILLLFLNGIGLAFGPLTVGLISDYLEPTYGVLSLRYAISFIFLASFVAIFFYWKAAQYYEADLKEMS